MPDELLPGRQTGIEPGTIVPVAEMESADITASPEALRHARDIAEFHRSALQKRRLRDLTAEKYMIHIDAEGDAQWADLLHGERVTIPPQLSGGPRQQSNLLRPMVENMVAYHTTMPFRFTVARALGRDRERSVVDQALVNHVSRAQRWNALFAEAMYMAAAYGHCPIHAYWHESLIASEYEPLYEFAGGVPGSVDCWVGDPFDTVYHSGDRRGNVHAFSYGRTLPAERVRKAFEHVPGAELLEGNDRLPSASQFQRIARRWLYGASRDIHGSATIYGGQGGQELIALICRETMPGVLEDWPDGRLEIIALDGAATTYEGEAQSSYVYGNAKLLHIGPLPAGVPSMVRVYSTFRFDDVLGKPYAADLDDLQMLLNQLETYANEYIRRSVRAPLAVPEGTDLDTLIYDDNVLLEVDATAQSMPEFMSLPRTPIDVLRWKIERIEEAMFRIGGWQAASRGESKSGDSGRKVLALARADDSVHGPVNQRFRESVEDYAGLVWRLYKEYADVPSVLDVLGDEAAYLADDYVSRDRLSDRPPHFQLVSGFGATTEAKGEQLMTLVTAMGADGQPLMTTQQFRAAWPDDSTYPEEENPHGMRVRRPRVINTHIRKMALQVYQSNPALAQLPLGHPQIQMLGQMLATQLDQQFPLLMDDDLLQHIDTLSLLTQDETEAPLTRATASFRQRMYYMWAQNQMLARQAAAQPTALPGGGETGGGEARQPSGGGGENTPRERAPGLRAGGTGGMASSMAQAASRGGADLRAL